jgi:sulfur transfer protein SufE
MKKKKLLADRREKWYRDLKKQAKNAPGIEKIWEMTKNLPSFTDILLEERGILEKCQHNWVWYQDETSTWKFAGFWRCSKCGLFRF